jgi:hypothetical protein
MPRVVVELEDDHPMMKAMRRGDPGIVAIAYDDTPYLMVIRENAGEKEAIRYVMPQQLRVALEAYERGEPFAPGSYELLPPRLKMDETEE